MTIKVRGGTEIEKDGGSDRRVRKVTKRAEVVQLRVAGWSWQEIAEWNGTTVSAAQDQFRQALREVPVEAVEEYRRIHGEQLERGMKVALAIMEHEYEAAHYDRALRALDRVVSVSTGLRTLWGTDAPQKRIVEVIDETAIAELRNRLEPRRVELIAEARRFGLPVPSDTIEAEVVGNIEEELDEKIGSDT